LLLLWLKPLARQKPLLMKRSSRYWRLPACLPAADPPAGAVGVRAAVPPQPCVPPGPPGPPHAGAAQQQRSSPQCGNQTWQHCLQSAGFLTVPILASTPINLLSPVDLSSRPLPCPDLPQFLELVVGFRSDRPLPPPASAATSLRDRALELLEGWDQQHGGRYKQVRAPGHCLRVCLPASLSA